VSADRWTGGQYSVFRALLGAYVIVHFLMLIPYGAEVFGAGGAIARAEYSPLMGVLPNPLAISDAPWAVTTLLSIGAASGILLAIGWFDRAASVLAAIVLAWLYQRNPLIANPSLPLLGWVLIVHAFTPPRPYGSLAAKLKGADPAWRLPNHLFAAVWIVLAVSYSYSGYTKLFSPAWVHGDAIRLVFENPLARDHWLRDLVLALPPIFLDLLTSSVLYVELLFAPLALFRCLRPALWVAMLVAQLGFLCFLNFADLTAPMLLVHLLTFDPRWLASRVTDRPATLLFDGHCAFCHATVRFAAIEDQRKLIRFEPLPGDGDSIVLLDRDRYSFKSRAVAGVLERLGGLWWLLGRLLRAVPRPLADFGYDCVGRIRYWLGGRVVTCPIPPAGR
jgi:predicted DCC family thiol-disulfide oxidoreductase YuxK